MKVWLPMGTQPPLPGSEKKKPARLTISVPPGVKGVIEDLTQLYEETRLLGADPEMTYMWTESRLVHSWIQVAIDELGRQMGVDLMDTKARKARIEKAISDAKRNAERDGKHPKR